MTALAEVTLTKLAVLDSTMAYREGREPQFTDSALSARKSDLILSLATVLFRWLHLWRTAGCSTSVLAFIISPRTIPKISDPPFGSG